MKWILILCLFSSCLSLKPVVYETVTDCNETEALEYIRACIASHGLDTMQVNLTASVRADCIKQAKEIFCKQVTRVKK